MNTILPMDGSVDLVEVKPTKGPEARILALLDNPKKMATIENRCQLGASIGTIAATIKIPAPTLYRWVERGKDEYENLDHDKVMTPYMRLWEIMSVGWAEARTLAEAAIQQRNPEKFLTGKTSRLLGDDWVEEEAVQGREDLIEKNTLHVGASMIESLKLLRKKGLSLDEIIDKDNLTLITSTPPEKKEDILKRNGIDLRNDSLPESLGYSADSSPPNSLQDE